MPVTIILSDQAANELRAQLCGVTPTPTPPTPTPTPTPPTPTPTPTPPGGSIYTLPWPIPPNNVSIVYAQPVEELDFTFTVGLMVHPVGRIQFSGGPNVWDATIVDAGGNVIATLSSGQTPWTAFVTDGSSSGYTNLSVGSTYTLICKRVTSEPNPTQPRCDIYT